MWKWITLFGSEFLVIPMMGFYFITKDFDSIKYLLIVLIIADFVGNITKLIFFKDRPSPMKYNNIIEKALAGSFPSLHTMRTFIILLFSLKYCIYFSPIFLGIYILVAISRVKLQKHFWADLMGGTIYALIFFVGFLGYLKIFG